MGRLILIFAFTFFSVLLAQSAGLSQAKKPAQEAKLTRGQVDKVQPGLTLVEVMAILGPRAQINPDPNPVTFKYFAPEVLVLWREGKERWVGVVFAPDKNRVLRVVDPCNLASSGVKD